MSRTNFTATNGLFLNNPLVALWRFEVVYSFANEISSSTLSFTINQPPARGSCSIYPTTGTTSTLFRVSCPDWFDTDGMKDYSLYGRSNAVQSFSQCERLAHCSSWIQRIVIASSDRVQCSTLFRCSIASWRRSNLTASSRRSDSRHSRLCQRIESFVNEGDN